MKYKITIYLILLKVSLIANEGNLIKKFDDENKKYAKIEKGFAYGESTKSNVTEKEHGIEKEIVLIRKILEKQLKVQENILDILQNEYEPVPKIIINAKGEKCIANSSADCFEMPIIAEARKIPVLKKWMQKGDLQSSVNYLQWQAKYFKEISKRAYNNVAAINQYGTQAYPTNYNTMGFNNATGIGNVIKSNVEKKVLISKLDKVNFIYFIGLNRDLDFYSMDNIVKFLRQYGNKIKIQFIFHDEKSMNDFKTSGKYSSEFKLLQNYKMSVKPKEFKKFNIYTSPSLVAINKDKKTAQTVLVGRASAERANKMILMYLRNQGIVKDVELNMDNAWKDNTQYGKAYLQKILGKNYIKEVNQK